MLELSGEGRSRKMCCVDMLGLQLLGTLCVGGALSLNVVDVTDPYSLFIYFGGGGWRMGGEIKF